MKGISSIVVVALVLMLVVVLISLTYNFTAFLLSPERTKTISFVMANCEAVGNERTFRFTIRNTGSKAIRSTELAVFLDKNRIEEEPKFSDINPESVDIERTFANKTSAQGIPGEHTITVSSPSGEISKAVVCP